MNTLWVDVREFDVDSVNCSQKAMQPQNCVVKMQIDRGKKCRFQRALDF